MRYEVLNAAGDHVRYVDNGDWPPIYVKDGESLRPASLSGYALGPERGGTTPEEGAAGAQPNAFTLSGAPVAEDDPIRPFTILDDARAAVYGERGATYGHPRDDFARIAALWNGYLNAKRSTGERNGGAAGIYSHDVACMMALLKMSRLMASPTHHDSWVDLAGYAAAGARAVGVDD